MTYVLLILVLAFLLRCVAFSGYVSGDDAAYITQAVRLLSGDFTPPDSHWGLRSALVLPTALSFAIFGISPITTSIVPMALSLASVVLVFRAGCVFFHERIGLLAAALVAICPIEIIFASHLFPYVYISFFSTLTLYWFLRGDKEGNHWLLLGAGFALGLAYLSRITALFALLFFAVYVLWQMKFKVSYILVAVGFLLVMGLEAIFLTATYQNPLVRAEVLFGFGQQDQVRELLHQDFSLSWFIEPFIRPLFEQEFLAFFFVIIIGGVWGLFARNPIAKILSIWVLVIFLYTCFGSTSISDYQPLRRLPRYLAPVVLPAILLFAYFLFRLGSLKLMGIAIIALAGSTVLAITVDGSRHVATQHKNIAAWLNSTSAPVVLPRTLYFDVAYFLEFDGRPNIAMFAVESDRSHSRKRAMQVTPNVVLFTDASEIPCGTYVFTDRYLELERLRSPYEKVREFEKPLSIAQRLLTTDWVLRIVGRFRDPRRLEDLKRKTASQAVELHYQSCVDQAPMQS